MPYTIGIDARKLPDFGIGTYIRNLVQQLAEVDEANRYVLVLSPQGRETLGPLPDRFEIVTERAPVYSLREQFTLSWRLARLGLDLYHAPHYVLPLWIPARSVVTIHDIIHLLFPQFLRNRLAFLYAQRMIRRSLTRGSRIISVSKTTRDDLRRYFDVGRDKIDVIYNGVEEVYHQHLEPEDLDRRLAALGLSRPYLLFVGNPKPHKNLDNVVQAYARALEIQHFDGPLVCVGDRSGIESKIRQRADQLRLGSRIQLLGHVAQEALPALYQGASLFLYPTLYEGFGLPVVEAMASRVAVITSNTSALKEIAEGYAHLVNPLDVDAIAKAIAQCMARPQHREALAELGLKRAAEFSWRRAAEKTLHLYRQVLEPGSGAT